MLNRDDPLPLYCQLKKILLSKLQSGALQPGDAVPPETTLCEQYGVSRYTVRQALDELVREGLLERKRGKGTFVSSKLSLSSWSEQRCTVEPGLLVGVVVPSLTDWYCASILSGIEQEIRKMGGAVICGQFGGDVSEERAVIAQLHNQGAAGLIVFPADRREPLPHLTDLNDIGKPVVLVDRYFPGMNADYVGSDNFTGAYQATNYLIKKGHRRIRFLAVNALGVSPAAERLAGYRQALLDAGLPISDKDVVRHDFWLQEELKQEQTDEYYENLAEKIFDDTSYTAIFASNDLIALSVLRVAKLRGIDVPEDVSLIGFDNRSFTGLLNKPLTTVEQSATQIGLVAAQLLIERIASPDKPGERRILPVKLIERATVAPPRKGRS